MRKFAGVGLAAAVLICLSGQAGAQALPQAGGQGQVAVLQGLDKVTAQISSIRAPIGFAVRFGTLQITARACVKRPPEEPPESSAFLEIYDFRQGGTPQLVYSGWMFASSPALAAMEHPVYDVWVLDCAAPSTTPGGAP